MSSPEPTSTNDNSTNNAVITVFRALAPDGEIWNKVEKEILRKNIQHYKTLSKSEKKQFLGSNVIMAIKKSFGNRYNKLRLDKDKILFAEWKKKKKVCHIHPESEHHLITRTSKLSHGLGIMPDQRGKSNYLGSRGMSISKR
jgi:hypothetical protein